MAEDLANFEKYELDAKFAPADYKHLKTLGTAFFGSSLWIETAASVRSCASSFARKSNNATLPGI